MTTGTLLSFKLEVETPIYYKFVISFVTQNPFVLNTRMNSNLLNLALMPAITEPTNYTRLSKKIFHRSR